MSTETKSIHVSALAPAKGRWIMASRSENMTLSDWIIKIVEKYMQKNNAQVIIPSDVKFSDLKLNRENNGDLSFNWEPLEKICEASGIPIKLIKEGPEDNASSLIVNWYIVHKKSGGDPDSVAEDLFFETLAEVSSGQTSSIAPGRA